MEYELRDMWLKRDEDWVLVQSRKEVYNRLVVLWETCNAETVSGGRRFVD